MALLFISKQDNLIFLLVAAFTLIGNVSIISGNGSNKLEEEIKRSVVVETHTEKQQQKTFKKQLKGNFTDLSIEPVTISSENDGYTEKLVIINKNSIIESDGKAIEQQISDRKLPPVAQKGNEKTGLSLSPIKSSISESHDFHQKEKEFLMKNEKDISDSLKTGFYFFLILSSGAIIYILFKIYRLRLSRAERKYGVQGDRTTQELTPLPISIEDGHSDDEDQTLFEVHHQNRIL